MSTPNSKVLLTGNLGFIGNGIHGPDGIDIKAGLDICDYIATNKYDIVIHTAAKVSVTESMKHPEEYIRTNVYGTLNMLRQHPEAHFIYLSTAAIYGEGHYHSLGDSVNPDSVYAMTKYAGECLVRMMAKSWVILRLTNVIGKGERGEPNVYQIFEKADILPIFGDGLQTRDFIPVEEVRKIILKMTTFADGKPAYTGIFNIGSGKSKTILEVALEFDKPMQFLPERKGEIRHFGITDAFYYSS